MVIRILIAALLGATIAGAIAWAVSGDEAWAPLVISCGVAVSVLFPLVLVARAIAGVGGLATPPVDVAAAASEGRLSLARVTGIAQTGTTINDQPVCDVDLVVTPRFGAPFATRTRRLVDLVEIPRLQPESVVVVALAGPPPAAVQLVMSPPDDWVLLAQRDETVRTVRTAPEFVPEPTTSTRPGLRRLPFALYPLGLLVGAGIALIPTYPTITAILAGETTLDEVRHASSWEGRAEADAAEQAEADAAASMFTGDNARAAVEQLVAETGPQATQLAFWSTHLSAIVPSAPGAGTLDSVDIDAGELRRLGAAGSQLDPEALEALRFDVSGVDYSILPSLVERAKELSGISEPDPQQPDQWVYLFRQSVPGQNEPQLVWSVPVDGEYYDARITFGLDGTVLDQSGGAPGSEAERAEG